MDVNTIVILINGFICLFMGLTQISIGISSSITTPKVTGAFFSTCGVVFIAYGLFLLFN